MGRRKRKFGDQDTGKGPLKWIVKEEAPGDWSVKRNSQSTDASGVADLFQKGYADQDEAMAELWSRKERNAARIQATKGKLANEKREQDALVKGIGTWTPPVPPDPDPAP
jgi:hypothetical protein